MTVKDKAISYLKTRYAEQCDLYPTLRNDVTEQGYISANLPHTMHNMRHAGEICCGLRMEDSSNQAW